VVTITGLKCWILFTAKSFARLLSTLIGFADRCFGAENNARCV
jgi:hypothetical protein